MRGKAQRVYEEKISILKALMCFSDSVFILHFDAGFLEAFLDIYGICVCVDVHLNTLCVSVYVRVCCDDSRESFDIYFTNLNEPETAAAGLQGCLMSWFNQTVNICLLHSYSVSSLASLMKVLKKYKGERERERERRTYKIDGQRASLGPAEE